MFDATTDETVDLINTTTRNECKFVLSLNELSHKICNFCLYVCDAGHAQEDLDATDVANTDGINIGTFILDETTGNRVQLNNERTRMEGRF